MKKYSVTFNFLGCEDYPSIDMEVVRIPNIGEKIFVSWPGRTTAEGDNGFEVVNIVTFYRLDEDPNDNDSPEVDIETYDIYLREY